MSRYGMRGTSWECSRRGSILDTYEGETWQIWVKCDALIKREVGLRGANGMTNIFPMTTRNVCVNKQTVFFSSRFYEGSGFCTKVKVVAAP